MKNYMKNSYIIDLKYDQRRERIRVYDLSIIPIWFLMIYFLQKRKK